MATLNDRLRARREASETTMVGSDLVVDAVQAALRDGRSQAFHEASEMAGKAGQAILAARLLQLAHEQ